MRTIVPFVYSPIYLFRQDENETGMVLRQMPLVIDGCSFALPELPDPGAIDYGLQWQKQYFYGVLLWMIFVQYGRDSFLEIHDLNDSGICVLMGMLASWRSVAPGGYIEKSPMVIGFLASIETCVTDRDALERFEGLSCEGWNHAVADLFSADSKEKINAVIETLRANLLQWHHSRAFHAVDGYSV